jgi:predicted Rossmann fold flavoprotein
LIYDCIIIGAGAAGLFCAASMEKKINGLILEKTPRTGTKLLMSGSGQCNITHAGSIKDFITRYGENGRKIRTCLYKYSNLQLTDFLENNGIRTKTRDDGKIFPASMDAREILDMLLRLSHENGFGIKYDSPVKHISMLPAGTPGGIADSDIWQIKTDRDHFLTKKVVIASGGCSYPVTGSDGSLFRVLREDLGLDITKLRPALSPVLVEEYPYEQLSGISFDPAGITIMRDGKIISKNSDALLLTHRDMSGPAVLNISKYVLPADRLIIDYVYPTTYEQVVSDLKQDLSGPGRDAASLIAARYRLPKRFCQLLVSRYGASPKKLAHALTGECFTVKDVAGFGKAMVTSGGIDMKEIKTSTMELKKHPCIYSIGEVCDIDGETGGYNLQFAYSSARAAAADISDRV